MSIDIFVQRGAGDKPGDDIIDPLIGSIPVAIQRGRNELDARSVPLKKVDTEALYRVGVRLGQLARFHDLLNGVEWSGKISGISHQVTKAENDSVQLTTKLKVERTA